MEIKKEISMDEEKTTNKETNIVSTILWAVTASACAVSCAKWSNPQKTAEHVTKIADGIVEKFNEKLSQVKAKSSILDLISSFIKGNSNG